MIPTINALAQPGEIVNAGILKGAPISTRFDAALLSPHIAVAESEWIIPLVCAEMYDQMKAKKAGRISNYNIAMGALAQAFPAAIDADYEILWRDHLLAMCGWATYVAALPFISFQTGSAGTFSLQSEHGNPVGVSGVKFLQDEARQHLGRLADMAKKFLLENKDKYPLFCAEKYEDPCACKDGSANNSQKIFGNTFIF